MITQVGTLESLGCSAIRYLDSESIELEMEIERENQYVYSPLRSERRMSRRRQCLACIKVLTQLPSLFMDYIFSSYTFEGSPRNARACFQLLQFNLVAAVATIVGAVCLFQFSSHSLIHSMNRSAIFPLYFPHAIGLALACKYQGSVTIGNFLGYYFARFYLVLRGPPEMSVSRGLILILIALLGVLETQIGAWLMHYYLCLKVDVQKKVPTIDNVSQAFFYVLIVLGTTLFFDTLIAVVTCLSEIVMWGNFLRFWATWWMGVVAGMLTLSPALIHLLAIGVPGSPLKMPNYFNLFKSIVLWIIVLGVLLVVFLFSVQSFVRPLPYLVFPLIIFASFRFNRVGWAIIVAVISLCCAWGTLHRNSSLYYMAGAPTDKASPSLILQIELFVSVMGLVGIVLAAAVREKVQLTNDLNKVNEDLEETINIRTSELRKANNELKISQKRAEHASHAKSDFLANMSHEIRTPIHGILGLTALLLESQLTSDQRESLLSVKECADLLLHIINSVLDLSKIEAGRLEVETVPFSVRKMVCSTLRMMQARAQAHNLQLLWHIEGEVPDGVIGDPGKLQQCLLNLVGNALKFTNEGSVTVRVSMCARKAQQTSIEREDTRHPAIEAPPLFPRPPKPPSRLAKLRSWASWPGPYFSMGRADSGKPQSCAIDVHESSDSDGYYNIASTKVAPVPDTEICSQPSTPETVEVEFEVQDTGIGISKEKLQDMFNPFTQADASTSRLYGGTGLGLCIVQRRVREGMETESADNVRLLLSRGFLNLRKNGHAEWREFRFVELLGGTIWAQSEVNKGSTFGFRVPFRMSSEASFAIKPELEIRGPLRFSSLDGAVPLRPVPPKNGLKRRAYSLDVLMRNMKFTLPSLVEGNDGEESMSSKSSSAPGSRGSSLQRTTTEEAILTVLDPEPVKRSTEVDQSAGLISDDPDARMARLTIRTSPADHRRTSSREGLGSPADHRRTGSREGLGSPADHRRTGSREGLGSPADHRRTGSREGLGSPESHRRAGSREGLPPSGPHDKLHKFEKSYARPKSTEEKRPKPPNNVVSSIDESSTESPEISSHSTVINVFDRTEGEQPLLKNISAELPSVDHISEQSSSSSSRKLEALSVPPQSGLLSSAVKADSSAKGFRKPRAEDGERSLHILLAEDNPINQKVATRQLQRYGHEVTIVNDGKLALEAVQVDHEAYDLVLMDVQMPNMDGLQATAAIRDMETQRSWGRLPILGLTAHAIQGYQETCLSHGMDGYLGKPFEIKQLLRQMHELLATNRGPRDHG